MKHHDLTPNTNTMNTKHTPGPWKKIGYQSVQDARGMEIAWCTVSAQFGKEFAEILTPEAAANARLIAAAPELLEALQVLSDAAGRVAQGATVIDERGFNTLAHPISVALAAIAKATEK